MIEILAGIIIITALGLLVWYQLQSPKMPPNALLLFDLLQEMGEEVTADQWSKDVPIGNKRKHQGCCGG